MRIMAYRIHGMRCAARNAVTACLRSVARAASMGGYRVACDGVRSNLASASRPFRYTVPSVRS